MNFVSWVATIGRKMSLLKENTEFNLSRTARPVFRACSFIFSAFFQIGAKVDSLLFESFIITEIFILKRCERFCNVFQTLDAPSQEVLYYEKNCSKPQSASSFLHQRALLNILIVCLQQMSFVLGKLRSKFRLADILNVLCMMDRTNNIIVALVEWCSTRYPKYLSRVIQTTSMTVFISWIIIFLRMVVLLSSVCPTAYR